MTIKDFTLAARALLTNEARDLLQGIYGLDERGEFEDAERLPALSRLPEAKATRQRLEQFLTDEASAGLSRPAAVEKLIREIAFTHLNRLAAFKMMEARKLIKGALDKYHSSNGFLFYLADHEDEEKLYEAGTLPLDALGESPRDAAYRHFLLWQSAQIAKEIKVLFDADNLASRLFPRPHALSTLVGWLNDETMQEHWAVGNDETIGWIYQHFNAEEKAEVFGRVFKQKKKVQQTEIPAVTQLFTPRWIVEYLVQNTLGRLWLQMHPDSELAAGWEYFVPQADLPSTPQKLAREITVLDPACGTMHFGLVAFDMLAAMYREELEKAGQSGWPSTPSVTDEAEIPASILEHNLFGIDIDLRAVQLSALTLYLRAKTLNPKAQIKATNLVCADVLLLNGKRIEEFIGESNFSDPVYERLIKAVWDELKEAGHFGSLLRPDSRITRLIESEKEAFKKRDLFSRERFDGKEIETPDYWDFLDIHIVRKFNEFAESQGARPEYSSGLFTGEAVKGMQLLDVMMRNYDVVVANPPYMSRRNMNPRMAAFLGSDYPQSKGDLYTAFIERCAEFLGSGGRLGMITQQSFMFISTYEKLRMKLMQRHALETMAHVGPRAFEEIVGEKVNTTLFVLRREDDASTRQNAEGVYFRLVRESDASAKRRAFLHARSTLAQGQSAPNVFRYAQRDFDAIPGSPWVYWITPGLRKLFVDLPKLGDVAQPKMGMGTRNNFRFLRFWWELGANRVTRNCSSVDESVENQQRWFPYMKGGDFQRWWGNQNFVVNFYNAGIELKEEQLQKYPYIGDNTAWIVPNEVDYFKRGVTFPNLTSGNFNARLSPGGFIFDVSGSTIFPPEIPLVLGIFNSSLASYILRLVNPTVNFQVGDLARLPIPTATSSTLSTLVERAIALSQAESREDETTYEFQSPPWRDDIGSTLEARALRRAELAEVERQIDEEVYALYDISPTDRAAIETELSSGVLELESAAPEESDESSEDGSTPVVDEAELLLVPAGRALLAKRWVSYAVGIALGRFPLPETLREREDELVDADGLTHLCAGEEGDLVSHVEKILDALLAESGASEVRVDACGGASQLALRNYLARDFWLEHHQRYRKRPIYWLWQSPRKNFSFTVFHERVTPDTLHLLRGPKYLGALRNEINRRYESAFAAAAQNEGAAKRKHERDAQNALDELLDLDAFDNAIKTALEFPDETGAQVGWQPQRDDGVLLNLAPLRALLPSWPGGKNNDLQKAWASLEKGEYDWSQTARRYWPKRVKAACRQNKSFALAHGAAFADK